MEDINSSDPIKIGIDGATLLLDEYDKLINQLQNLDYDNSTERFKYLLRPYLVYLRIKLGTCIKIINQQKRYDSVEISTFDFDGYSLYDVFRSVYECYLQVCYIVRKFREPKEQGYFHSRFLCQSFSQYAALLTSIGGKKREEVEREALAQKNFLLEKFDEFITNDVRSFEKRNGLPKWYPPQKIFWDGGVSKEKHDYIYKLSSNYAHAEPFVMWTLNTSLEFKEGKAWLKIDKNNLLFIVDHLFSFSLLSFEKLSLVFEQMTVILSDNGFDLELIGVAKKFLQSEDVGRPLRAYFK